MLEVDVDAIDDKSQLPSETFLGYGPTRSGKTTWFATFPRPIFLADATEKGWDSAIRIPDEMRFESGVKPIVIGLQSQADWEPALARAAQHIASKRCITLVVDSITYYADTALNGIIGTQTKPDMRQAYGTLGNHLRDVRIKAHSIAPIVGWTALVNAPDEEHPTGGPMIPGKQGDKFGAGVNFLFYFRKEVPANPTLAKTQPPRFEIRTKQYQRYIAGTRLGEQAELMPDPFVGTYSDFLTTRGYDVEAIRASLPPMPKETPKPIAVSRPPIVRATQVRTTPVVITKPVS